MVMSPGLHDMMVEAGYLESGVMSPISKGRGKETS